MEIIPRTSLNGKWNKRSYWRRNRYQRLGDQEGGTKQRNVKIVKFGGTSNNPRKYWRIKAVPKLKLKINVFSPLKIWRKLKNAYIDMMVNLAGNVGSLNTNKVFGNKRIPKDRQGKIVYSNEEVENRLIFEIYKVLEAKKELEALEQIQQRN